MPQMLCPKTCPKRPASRILMSSRERTYKIFRNKRPDLICAVPEDRLGLTGVMQRDHLSERGRHEDGCDGPVRSHPELEA